MFARDDTDPRVALVALHTLVCQHPTAVVHFLGLTLIQLLCQINKAPSWLNRLSNVACAISNRRFALLLSWSHRRRTEHNRTEELEEATELGTIDLGVGTELATLDDGVCLTGRDVGGSLVADRLDAVRRLLRLELLGGSCHGRSSGHGSLVGRRGGGGKVLVVRGDGRGGSAGRAVGRGAGGAVLTLGLGKLVLGELVTAVEDTHTHHREQVVCRIRVVVDTAEESSGSVLANLAREQVAATRVLVEEGRDVVDEAVDNNEGASLGLLDKVVPRDDGEVGRGLGPLELLTKLVSLLELHRKTTLLDLVVGEGLEVRGETELAHGANEPLGGVELVPLNSVAVVHGELVVEVVVALADGDESGEEVVAGRHLVVKSGLAEVVSERVDAEGGVVHEEKSKHAGEEEAAAPVTPAQTGNKGRKAEAEEEEHGDVELVLELDDGVLAQVRDVGNTGLATGLDEHPAEVRPEETEVGSVGVKVGVGVAVVSAVTAGPPVDGALDGTRAHAGQEVLERERCVVGTVGPKTVVAGGDAETSEEIVTESPSGGVLVPAGGEEAVEGEDGRDGESQERDPLDLAENVLELNGGERLLGGEHSRDVVVRDVGVGELLLGSGLRILGGGRRPLLQFGGHVCDERECTSDGEETGKARRLAQVFYMKRATRLLRAVERQGSTAVHARRSKCRAGKRRLHGAVFGGAAWRERVSLSLSLLARALDCVEAGAPGKWRHTGCSAVQQPSGATSDFHSNLAEGASRQGFGCRFGGSETEAEGRKPFSAEGWGGGGGHGGVFGRAGLSCCPRTSA
ncbi:hypothetical protein L1887_53026 [Cichorium endivia]|nr:hypothetical protein L1887_53026 [Cichorium endivia]